MVGYTPSMRNGAFSNRVSENVFEKINIQIIIRYLSKFQPRRSIRSKGGALPNKELYTFTLRSSPSSIIF